MCVRERERERERENQRKLVSRYKIEEKVCESWLIDFNDMSTHLELFYA